MSESSTTTQPTTARDTFHQLAALVASGFSPSATEAPEGRAARTAATLREEGELAGDLELTLGDAYHGLQLLAQTRADDLLHNVAVRRATCAEIAALIQPAPTDGDPLRLAAVYRTVERQLHGATDEHGVPDQRRRAIAARAGREAAELEQLLRHRMGSGRGTLTYRRDRGDWLLELANITASIDGPPPPGNGDGHAVADQLRPRVRPFVEHLLSGPRFAIVIIDPDGVDVLGQHPSEGLVLAVLGSSSFELTASVPRSSPLI